MTRGLATLLAAPVVLIAFIAAAWFAITALITAFICWHGLVSIAAVAMVMARIAVDDRPASHVILNRRAES